MAEEKRYEQKIKKLLNNLGAYHVKQFGCGYTKAGVPDILACLNGRFVAIEVKATKGRPSELQLYNLRKIDACGGYAILAYPDDFEALETLLRTGDERAYEHFKQKL